MNDRKHSSMTPAVWACAAILGLNLILGSTGTSGMMPSHAAAQTGSSGQPGTTMMPEPPFNAADQRKRMIEALTQLGDRMARIEARLEKGVSVKVIEMPASKKD
ncbi:MAG: hypothetical protein AB7K52_02475 [Phycisphaerales bacterium]